MNGLRSVWLVVPMLAIVCGAAAAPLLIGLLPGCSATAHHQGGHCPCSGADGTPCASGCPCLGCHAPLQVAVSVDPGLPSGAPAAGRACVVPPDGLHADDPIRSVFHPPRRPASA